MNAPTQMRSAHRSHPGDRLDALFDRYMQASDTLSAVREAHIERLGDSMCDRSLAPPRQSDLDALDALVNAAAQARDLYTRCSLAFASALIGEVNAAVARKLARGADVDRRADRTAGAIHDWIDDVFVAPDSRGTAEPS